MGSIDENYKLMQDAQELRDIRAEYELIKTKYETLEHAVRKHRKQIGKAYGIGSFKTQHAANMELWDHIKSGSFSAKVVDKVKKAAGLTRPAMMEETE